MNLAHSIRKSRFIRKLSAYAAASTSLTACDASAEIVHVDMGSGRPLDGFTLDFNLDGVDEFSFAAERFYAGGCHATRSGHSCSTDGTIGSRLVVDGLVFLGYGSRWRMPFARRFSGNELIQYTTFSSFAPRAIVSATGYRLVDTSLGSTFPIETGEFRDQRGFLGLLFTFDGTTSTAHYGWADIESGVIFRFAYEAEVLVPILAGDVGPLIGGHGDTDRDADVDLDDLNNVRNHFGQQGVDILGDDNQDGIVDLDDLNTVRNNFGASSESNPVPEPPSLVLLAAGAAGLAVLRRKRGATTHA